MMAWILVSLLASFAGNATVVASPPDANAAPPHSMDGGGLPPDPK